MGSPDAPWHLSGEIVVGVIRGVRTPLPRPVGVSPLPGPILVWAAHWAQTPVGPYSELGVAAPSRLGPRPGMCVVMAVVTSAQARMTGRLAWGFPSELGDLRWAPLGVERCLAWPDRGIELRATPHQRGLPFALALRSPQRRGDGPVVVPSRVRGWIRRADIALVAPEEDPLAPLAGIHTGFLVSGRRVILHAARRPSGAFGTLTAPLRSPDVGLEPGLSGRCR